MRHLKNVVEEFTGNVVTAEKLAESIKLINNKRKALERLYNLRKNENLPISGCDVLLISQIAFYDDPARFTQMTNKLCDELDQRVKRRCKRCSCRNQTYHADRNSSCNSELEAS